MENGKMNIKTIAFYILHFTFYISLLGCATKTTPVYAVIKTPDFKVADQGFLKEGFGYKALVIYKTGNVPVKIVVKNSVVCLNGRCLNKKKFIKSFLGANYPSDFLDKLLEYKCPKNFYCIKKEDTILFKDRNKKITIFLKTIKDDK